MEILQLGLKFPIAHKTVKPDDCGSTSQASARANPPPSNRMTLHGIRLLTVGQSSRGGDGPTGLLLSADMNTHRHSL